MKFWLVPVEVDGVSRVCTTLTAFAPADDWASESLYRPLLYRVVWNSRGLARNMP